MSGLSRALVALAVAGFVLGLAALALVTASDREDVPGPSVVLALTLGWAFIGAGLYAWWRRPENRIGALMTMVGFVWFLGALTSADSAWAFTIGLALSSLWIAALVHMLVAFPTGRVAPGLERNLVRLVWFIALIAGRSRCSSSRTRTATTARTTCCWCGRTRPRRPCSRRSACSCWSSSSAASSSS